MISSNEFIRKSLELHLFFARIIKEHAYFLAISFTPKQANLTQQASIFQKEFEKALSDIIYFSNGVVSPAVLESQEVVTPFTLRAELNTVYFTGMDINMELTKAEQGLQAGNPHIMYSPVLEKNVEILNSNMINLVSSFIQFQNDIITRVLSCDIFTSIYPLQLKHIVKEAKVYVGMMQKLQKREEIMPAQASYAKEAFWNDIMGEHAEFIRGLLDPSEKKLIAGAEYFAKEFEMLTQKAQQEMKNSTSAPSLTDESLDATEGIQDFKEQATQGLLECKIQSIIMPLLADHVLREANHYLRLLRMFEEPQT